MRTMRMRGVILTSCLLVMIVAAGCFQAAGDGMQATSVAQGIATFTRTPSLEPSETPVPSETSLISTAESTSPTPESAGSVLQQDGGEQSDGEDIQSQQLEFGDMTATALIERATAQAATATALAFPTEVIVTLPPVETATPPIAVQPTQPIIGGADCIHQVQPGDRNLWRISLLYGVTVHQIAASTGLANIQLIHIGDQLVIPGCGTTGHIPPPITGGGDQGGGGSGGGLIHTVVQGETLYKISLQYGVSVSSIAAANGIGNINLIYIGDQLVIP